MINPINQINRIVETIVGVCSTDITRPSALMDANAASTDQYACGLGLVLLFVHRFLLHTFDVHLSAGSVS